METVKDILGLRPSAVVNVATDWFTGAGLENLSKCTVEFYNECIIIIRRKDNPIFGPNALWP